MFTIRNLGLQPYSIIWEQMKTFTARRKEDTPDELWLLEHHSVYTQGQAGKAEHILNPHTIPVVQTDRGGQVTYHGPGQLLGYILMDIRRQRLGIRTLVTRLEQLIIFLLAQYDIPGHIKAGAPGVYVQDKKIASIGLRVKNGCTYHGIALNVAMDLAPFKGINPCGYTTLDMTQVKDFIDNVSFSTVRTQFINAFITHFES